MFASQLGIRLVLWIGKTVPTPAPYEVTTALSHAKVINDSEGDDGFELTFTLGKNKAAEFSLLQSGLLDPENRVIIGVLMGVTPEPLIDGVIFLHQLAPSNEPGHSTLTVQGRDVRVMLSLKEKSRQFKNQPDSLIVTQILADYSQFGLLPPYQVTPTPEVPIELQRVPRQNEPDLEFIQRLARRNGFVFYVEPLTFGVNTAYWGPQKRAGLPQPALSLNLGSATNLNSLNFSNDALAPVGAEGKFVEPITKTSLSIPPLPSLKIPPLASRLAQAHRTKLLRNTARKNPAQAAITALAETTNAPDPVAATGELDGVRYGSVLRARRLVGVRGAGLSYNGNYYVSRVTHEIERGKYTQQFTLKRDGTGALLPVVRP